MKLHYSNVFWGIMVFMIARWFAKRFLLPDIVAEYSYIFLWDEDLGVEDFHPEQYVGFNLLLIETTVCEKLQNS